MSVKEDITNLIGKKFNSLTILKDLGNPNKADRKVLASCGCGNIKEYYLFNIKSGKSKCCGCLKGCRVTHGLRKHKLYTVYYGILDRCYNKNCKTYPYYGARGVVICAEWRNDFLAFYNWGINNGWQEGLEIDKDIKGNGLIYSPQTCCFVTSKKNANKRRSSKLIEYKGEIKTAAEWSDIFNISQQTFYKRRKRGLDIFQCLEMPLQKNQFAAR